MALCLKSSVPSHFALWSNHDLQQQAVLLERMETSADTPQEKCRYQEERLLVTQEYQRRNNGDSSMHRTPSDSREATLGNLKQDIEERDQEIRRLRRNLDEQEQRHEHALAYLRDDYEQLRTRLLRRLKADVLLLDEGLHALRRDKGHVMEDHAERTLDALRNEIKKLQSGD